MPRLRWRNRLSALLRAVAERLEPAPAAPPDAPAFWLERASGGRPVGTGLPPVPPGGRGRRSAGEHRRPFRLRHPAEVPLAASGDSAAPEPAVGPDPVTTGWAGQAGGPPERDRRRRRIVTARPRPADPARGPAPGGAGSAAPGSDDRGPVRPDRPAQPDRPAGNPPWAPGAATGPAPDAAVRGGPAPTGAAAGHPATGALAGAGATGRSDRARPGERAPSNRHPPVTGPNRPRPRPEPQGSATADPGEPVRPDRGPAHPAGPARSSSTAPQEAGPPGTGGYGYVARPAPTSPAGGNRLRLRPSPGDPLPGRPAARLPARAEQPPPAPPVPVESMWPQLPARPAPAADPGPAASVQLARWLRLTSEQAAT